MKTFLTVFLSVAALVLPFSSQGSMRMRFYAITSADASAFEKDASKLKAFLSQTNHSDALNIDKAWHGIHYLLTGSAKATRDPASLAVLGGKEIGADLGYGPARLLSPSQVKEVAAVLRRQTPEELRAKYAPKRMEKLEIYPDIWVRDGNEARDYLIDYYQKLARFYERAASAGQAVIITLT